MFQFLLILGLLSLPSIAITLAGMANSWLVGYAILINAVTCLVYAWDKRRARIGGWRVAEAQLHLLELLGGWPCAYAAQRTLRHKCSKRSYQFVFWLIVAAYQAAAVFYLSNRP